MSGVKRFEAHYLTDGVMGGKALARAEMVLASDYDRDMIRISELHENAHAVAKATMAANADLQINFDTVKAECDELRAQVEAMREALEFAAKSLANITSSDGSGHADIALSVLRLAGMNADERETLVEGWKAKAQWRIDAALREDKT